MSISIEAYKRILEVSLEDLEEKLLVEEESIGNEYWEGYYEGRIEEIKKTIKWLSWLGEYT